MPQTPSQLKAARDFAKRKTAEGWRKSTFWIAPDNVARIEAAQARGDSRDAFVNRALAAFGPSASVVAPKPVKPVSAPEIKVGDTITYGDGRPAETVIAVHKPRAPYGSRLKSQPKKGSKK